MLVHSSGYVCSGMCVCVCLCVHVCMCDGEAGCVGNYASGLCVVGIVVCDLCVCKPVCEDIVRAFGECA